MEEILSIGTQSVKLYNGRSTCEVLSGEEQNIDAIHRSMLG